MARRKQHLPRPKEGEYWRDAVTMARKVRVWRVSPGRVWYENTATGRRDDMALRTFQYRMEKCSVTWTIRMPKKLAREIRGLLKGQRAR